VSWIGGIGSFFDIRFPAAGPGGFGFPGWGGVGGSYNPGRTVSVFNPWLPGAGSAITTSRDLPGSTHWDPAPVPVGDAGGGGGGGPIEVNLPGITLPVMGFPWPDSDGSDTREPPVTYIPPPILLPGQTDPGREEQETEETEVAHTWTHVGSQIVGALFGQDPLATGLAFGSGIVGGNGAGTLGPFDPGVPAGANGGTPMVPYTGSCPPRKTRTLTIDCATGQEVKRKRRRRPALLTQGDMGVLFQIASLPNNANVRVALAGAIRR